VPLSRLTNAKQTILLESSSRRKTTKSNNDELDDELENENPPIRKSTKVRNNLPTKAKNEKVTQAQKLTQQLQYYQDYLDIVPQGKDIHGYDQLEKIGERLTISRMFTTYSVAPLKFLNMGISGWKKYMNTVIAGRYHIALDTIPHEDSAQFIGNGVDLKKELTTYTWNKKQSWDIEGAICGTKLIKELYAQYTKLPSKNQTLQNFEKLVVNNWYTVSRLNIYQKWDKDKARSMPHFFYSTPYHLLMNWCRYWLPYEKCTSAYERYKDLASVPPVNYM